MKQLLEILIGSVLLTLNIQLSQAEQTDPYIDALSIEADDTSMKSNDNAIVTDEGPEPAVVPSASDDIDALSKKIANRLELILTGSSSKEVKQKGIVEIISNAVKKGHEIDAIQSAVNDAMVALSKQEGLDIKTETLTFVEMTVDEIVSVSKDIAQGDPNDPYINALNDELNSSYLPEKVTEVVKADVAKTSRQQPTVRTIVVLKGDSLSKIAGKIYGSVNKYRLLYEANREILNNPNRIKIGQILKVPLLPLEKI